MPRKCVTKTEKPAPAKEDEQSLPALVPGPVSVPVPVSAPGPVPGRVEIAELAQAMMPEALKRLSAILHTSGSDLASLQAFRALKDAAYGKDPLNINGSTDFESLTTDELKAAIEAELGADFAPGGFDADGTA